MFAPAAEARERKRTASASFEVTLLAMAIEAINSATVTVFPRVLRQKTWLVACMFGLTVFLLHAIERAWFRRVIDSTGSPLSVAPEVDLRSPTGYKWGQRNQILSTDGAQWVMQTQRMLAGDGLRIRSVNYDNYPAGRDVHWSSSMHGWLGGLAWIWNMLSGRPLSLAVEDVAPYANPLLLGLFLFALIPFLWRRFGAAAAGLVSVGMATVYPFCELFPLGDPDHHGIAVICCMASVLFLLVGGAGWTKAEPTQQTRPIKACDFVCEWLPSAKQARRWFVASGAAGGAGLWISTATVVPVLAGIGVGAIVATGWFGREHAKTSGYQITPELWRAWGIAGAAASLMFYLLEYFPSHFGMRLEVNHPLYAFAWLGAGDLVCRFCRRLQGEGWAKVGRDQVFAITSVVSMLVLPAVIFFTKGRTFLVIDPTLWALHSDYIVEFNTIFWRLKDLGLQHFLFVANPLPLLGIGTTILLFNREIARPMKGLLVVVLMPAAAMLLLACHQVRWMGISDGLWFATLAATAFAVSNSTPGLRLPRWWKTAAIVLLVGTALPMTWRVARFGFNALTQKISPSSHDLRAMIVRDTARWLRARVGGEECVVLSAPGSTTPLIYHGGFKGIGTLYWENKDGLDAMIDIFSATDPDQARTLMQKRGITHIVVFSWNTFADEAARLAAGLHRDQEAPEGTFMGLLAKGGGCPFWLQPVHYPMPRYGIENNERVLVYEVVPEQSREMAALRHAQLLFASGDYEGASQFLRVMLDRFPNYLPAWITLAQVQLCLDRVDAFRTSVAQIGNNIGAAAQLVFSDRLNLAIVLAAAGDTTGARTQIRACMAEANEHNLRRLPQDSLYYFSYLIRELGEDAAHPEIVKLALSLLPKERLKQFEATLTAKSLVR